MVGVVDTVPDAGDNADNDGAQAQDAAESNDN
jgi:hypothetical protein